MAAAVPVAADSIVWNSVHQIRCNLGVRKVLLFLAVLRSGLKGVWHEVWRRKRYSELRVKEVVPRNDMNPRAVRVAGRRATRTAPRLGNMR